ncbi:hypothetical protein AUK40_06555 [Candidatus Wirthbacteria bacterium CG2_30_54_11]|uniref:RNase NYN domain-containing protein n=1 Tax=Candidatus Wirthbacteria bacterium CG2_30_54_11 TaxID=1817892 RepID=A0A1J5ICM9_9BACT|nr:MAG: hypothetical protein AUK40_06555 [Candidatus Wirthbacteria bacterium CG2_30_54_11]
MPLIIDGNNAVGHWGGIEEDSLVRLLSSYSRSRHLRIELFFDGERYLSAGSTSELLRIHYSGHGHSADDAILQFISTLRDKSNWRLVTDDRELQREASWMHMPYQKVVELKKEVRTAGPAPKRMSDSEPAPDKPGYEADPDELMQAMIRGKKK